MQAALSTYLLDGIGENTKNAIILYLLFDMAAVAHGQQEQVGPLKVFPTASMGRLEGKASFALGSVQSAVIGPLAMRIALMLSFCARVSWTFKLPLYFVLTPCSC